MAGPISSGSKRWIAITISGATMSGSHRATFDVENGTFTTQNNPVGAKITQKKHGYWLCEMVVMPISSGSATVGIRLSDIPINALHAWQGDGASGVFCGAPQMELGIIATSNIPTAGYPDERSSDVLNLMAHGPRFVYREYTPLGSSELITETVPYTGELCPAGHIRLLKVLND
jgi:hypothetical protein